MNWSVIVQALEVYLETLGLGMTFAWDNVVFPPVGGASQVDPYIRVMHLPVDTNPLTIGRHGVMDTEGILVLGLNYPAGEGSGAALSKADELAGYFQPGSSLPAGSGHIVVSRTTVGSKEPSSQPDWWILPVTVYFNAYHNY